MSRRGQRRHPELRNWARATFQEGCLREVFAPEGLPTGDRAFVGTEAFRASLTRRGVDFLPHGRADQHDDGG